MISIILLIFAGILNAAMDVLKTRFKTSIFRFWKFQNWIDPSIAKDNKWKIVDGFIVGERFFGSSTFLVWLTDLWHFCKFIMLWLIMSTIVFYEPIFIFYIDIIILYCSFTIPFELFYSKFFIKNNFKI
jgi:hypothetical protein